LQVLHNGYSSPTWLRGAPEITTGSAPGIGRELTLFRTLKFRNSFARNLCRELMPFSALVHRNALAS
jgi:hypothetical protein